jgi:hypothetical protein
LTIISHKIYWLRRTRDDCCWEIEMSIDPGATKGQRLAEIFRRMTDAPLAASFSEAYQLLCETITAVEDEMTSIPNNPPAPPADDGRIYPPQDDSQKMVPGRPDLRRYISRGHNTLIGDNGAITILDRSRMKVFVKLGADGKDTD